jgi:hypothetical protein
MNKRGILKIGGCCLVVLFLLTGTCSATATSSHAIKSEVLKFSSTMDTMIVENGPNNNFGPLPTVEIRNSASGWEEDALVRFNLTSLQPGTPIRHATLYMFYSHYQDNNPAWRKISLHRITSDWDENTVTWDTRPNIDSLASSADYVPLRTGVWMHWDVTADVRGFINGDAMNYGWRLIDERFWNGWNIPRTHYYTKENGYNIPYLEITISGQNLTSSFLVGRITNLTTQGDVISFHAVHLKMMTFAPLTVSTYTGGETITVEGTKAGVITVNYICGFFKVKL